MNSVLQNINLYMLQEGSANFFSRVLDNASDALIAILVAFGTLLSVVLFIIAVVEFVKIFTDNNNKLGHIARAVGAILVAGIIGYGVYGTFENIGQQASEQIIEWGTEAGS